MKPENSVVSATLAGIFALGTAMMATSALAVPDQP